ncbi:MAG: hypothetical protein KDA60_05235, partial [Planctomycetales bacterium]|nr:hypothetical protein [Planctomycetales bacterium]
YFMTARLTPEEREERKRLFGKMTEGFRSLRPYDWRMDDGRTILEIPVTTIPWLKIPMHLSYLLYLRQFSELVAWGHYQWAMLLCRCAGVRPSLLLHPLDFLGRDDDDDLAFFPAMNMPGRVKLKFMERVLTDYCARYQVGTMRQHAVEVRERKVNRVAVPE